MEHYPWQIYGILLIRVIDLFYSLLKLCIYTVYMLGYCDCKHASMTGGEWRLKYERAIREIEFTKKRLQQEFDDKLEVEQQNKRQLERRVSEDFADRHLLFHLLIIFLVRRLMLCLCIDAKSSMSALQCKEILNHHSITPCPCLGTTVTVLQ